MNLPEVTWNQTFYQPQFLINDSRYPQNILDLENDNDLKRFFTV